jgi:hypothetical protein
LDDILSISGVLDDCPRPPKHRLAIRTDFRFAEPLLTQEFVSIHDSQ